MITTILILAIAVWALSLLPAVYLYEFHKAKIVPLAFATDDYSAYGLRKASPYRTYVAANIITVSTIIDALMDFGCKLFKKTWKPLLYRRTEMLSWVTDPASLNPDKIKREQMMAYLFERVIVINKMIDDAGWRAIAYRYVIEMPTNEASPARVQESDGKKFNVPALRVTRFILY